MVSATPSASVPDTRTSASEDRGVAELHRYAEWPQGTHAVIAVALLAALRLFASHDHSCAKTDSKPCIPSPSVTIVLKMLESCDNRAGSAKRHGNVFPRHAEWPHVADAVIEAGNSNGLFHRPLAPALASARTPRAAPWEAHRPGRAAAARGGNTHNIESIPSSSMLTLQVHGFCHDR